MKQKIVMALLALIVGTAFSQSSMPAHVVSNIDWINYTSERGNVSNGPTSIDANQNVYSTGYTGNSTPVYDILTQKRDNLGNIVFSVAYDNGGYDKGNAIKIHGVFTYVAGVSYSTSGNNDGILLCYNATGGLVWQYRFDNTSQDDEYIDVKTDASQNAYVTAKSMNGSGNYDIITHKINSSGTLVWSNTFAGTSGLDDTPVGVVIIGGYVYVAGNSADASNGQDWVIRQIDMSTGASGWTKRINGVNNVNDALTAVIISGGDIVACGEIDDTGNLDAATIRLDGGSGNIIYQTNYDFAGVNNRATALVRDSTGNIGTVGIVLNGSIYEYHTQILDSLGNPITVNIESTGLTSLSIDPRIACDTIAHHFYVCGEAMKTTKDMFVYQITPTGNTTWREYIDGQSSDIDAATGLAVNGTGVVYLCGLARNSTGINYDFTTAKISQTPVYFPPDFNNEAGSLGVLFYENKGQLVDVNDSLIPEVSYYTNTYPETYIQRDKITYVFTRIDSIPSTEDTLSRVDLTFLESNQHANPSGYSNVQGTVNYYLGHCPNGITDVKGNERIITPNLYPDIDLHYYSNEAGVKYYWVVKPGADPNRIIFNFNGAVSSGTVAGGGLSVNAGIGSIDFDVPIMYQAVLVGTVVTIVPITAWTPSFVPMGTNTFKFGYSTYNTALPLIIQMGKAAGTAASAASNPEWGTMYGGTKDEYALDIVADATGNLYATGGTGNATFPVLLGQSTYSAGFSGGAVDAFITRFDQNYVRIYSTFYGGPDTDKGNGITYDSKNGKIYVCGTTSSGTVFPTIFLPSTAGTYVDNTGTGGFEGKGFILRFNASDGKREWATKFGSGGYSPLMHIEADDNGNFYVLGEIANGTYTQSCTSNTVNALPLCNPGGGAYFQSVNKSAAFGNSSDNNFYKDLFLAKFNQNTQLVWSTLFGGRGEEYAGDIAIDNTNQKIYISGITKSVRVGTPVNTYTANGTFPLFNSGSGYFQQDINGTNTPPKLDGFISKLSMGGVLEHSTFFGGQDEDGSFGLLVDNSGNLFLSGYTITNFYGNTACAVSTNGGFPFCPASSYTQAAGGSYDSFVAKFDSNLNLTWSTYYGGNDSESAGILGAENRVAMNKFTNDVYVVGTTRSCAGYPALQNSPFYYQPTNSYSTACTNGIAPSDGFVLGFDNNGVRNLATQFGGNGGALSTLPRDGDFICGLATVGNRVYICGKTYAYLSFPFQNPGNGAYFQGTVTVNSNYSDAFYAQLRTNSTITNLKEIDEAKIMTGNVKLFPNPASNSVNLEWNNITPNATKAAIAVYNIMGQVVRQIETEQVYGINGNFVRLDGLSSGVYIVIVNTGKQTLNAKFIKD